MIIINQERKSGLVKLMSEPLPPGSSSSGTLHIRHHSRGSK
jgi:hypothetical protein